MKIVVFGAHGFLGSHLTPRLRLSGYNLLTPKRSEIDLLSLQQCISYLKLVKPDSIINLAAYSGGIGANQAFPADFYFRNTILTANVFEAACRCEFSGKIYYPIGGCSYPADALSPLHEEMLWTGLPQKESAAYSTSKLMGTIAAVAYNNQHGIRTQLVIPGNMYGEFDNFDLSSSHVIPALIRKFVYAKRTNQNSVTLWGTGKAIRDFVYAGDVAEVIASLVSIQETIPIMNISSGNATSINDLAMLIADLTRYKGEIFWDTSKSDGQLTKVFSIDRLIGAGFHCETSLEEGLRRTIEWYQTNTPDILV
jgi:GDP-L-fucose synthase